ncbi:MAG: hypothetical protein IKE91_02185 [Clostridia bacterium]|nr:hypothetical protein [Clostridia bacterium]
MKKTLKVLLVLIIFLTSLFCFAGCGKKKTAKTADEFYSIMTEKKFVIKDSKSEYSSHNEIVRSYVAAPSDLSYQIEFLELDSDASAKNMFASNQRIFQDTSSSNKAESSVSVSNYAKYTLESNGKYKVISRIDNTLVYVDAEIKYKDDVNKLLDELGY